MLNCTNKTCISTLFILFNAKHDECLAGIDCIQSSRNHQRPNISWKEIALTCTLECPGFVRYIIRILMFIVVISEDCSSA